MTVTGIVSADALEKGPSVHFTSHLVKRIDDVLKQELQRLQIFDNHSYGSKEYCMMHRTMEILRRT